MHQSPSGSKDYQLEDINKKPQELTHTPYKTAIYGSLILEIQRLEFGFLQGIAVSFLR